MPSLKRYTKTSMLIKNTVKQIPRAEASSEERNPAQEREREENLRKIEETFLHLWGHAWL